MNIKICNRWQTIVSYSKVTFYFPLLKFSNWYSEKSNVNLKFQNEENLFFIFLLIIMFLLVRILTWTFCVVLCNAIEKSYAKNLKKSIHEIPSFANFFYICAPKPLGRLDPSRFERVKWSFRMLSTCRFV